MPRSECDVDGRWLLVWAMSSKEENTYENGEEKRKDPSKTSVEDGKKDRLTLVISLVKRSISRSSAVRSANPGSACFACSLSREFTVRRVEVDLGVNLGRGRQTDGVCGETAIQSVS